MNRLPMPGWLSSVTSPPMICVSSLVMVRPSPTPGTPAARPWSMRWNGSNTRSWSARPMPIPVSETVISAMAPRQRKPRLTLPARVNFTALDSRLIRICRSRRSSV